MAVDTPPKRPSRQEDLVDLSAECLECLSPWSYPSRLSATLPARRARVTLHLENAREGAGLPGPELPQAEAGVPSPRHALQGPPVPRRPPVPLLPAGASRWPHVEETPGVVQGPPSVCGRPQHAGPAPGQSGELLDGGSHVLPGVRAHPVEEGDPGPPAAGVEPQAAGALRGPLPVPLLAAGWLDGGSGGRPAAGGPRRGTALLPLCHAQGVLECPVGEGLCQPAEGEAVESVLDCGLVRGHAYGVTALRKVWKGDNLLSRNGMSRLLMIRMRNPWGTTDWTGTWSQRSDEWQQLNRPEREKMGIQVRDVGEFWMEFGDFCRYFTDVVLCHLVEKARLWSGSHWREESCFGEWAPAPGGSVDHGAVLRSRGLTAGPGPAGGGRRDGRQRGGRKEPRLGERQRAVAREGGKERVVKEKAGGANEEESQGRWSKEEEEESQSVEVEGEWGACVDKRSRCGGCINHMETFLHNPQFLLDVRGREEEVLICLQQEDRRRRRREGRGENLPIGFEVLKAKNSMPPCVWAVQVEVNRSSRVQCLTEQEASSIYMDSRSVTLRGTLPSGRYAVLPTTFLPGASGRFLLRVFSHAHLHLRELNADLPSPSSFQCCLPEPWVVTTVHLQRAEVLSRTKYTAPDVYAVVRCEDRVVRTRVHEQNSSPEFNLRTIFYRRQPRAHISVELWSRGLILDTFLGTASLHTANSERGRSHVIDLRGGLSQRLGSQGCCVYVETSSSECLTDL
ncbi:calpain-5-like isoform X2 [Gadus chalcogrammus]|uniref:calpain-5-like isoform X2 n=1 Tax=Gadus chalcogrammus TaxID=1042646 RepID=UPI0024C4B012|nr:calpain-5-like isoform X2 [Gadus chalcogrammus]